MKKLFCLMLASLITASAAFAASASLLSPGMFVLSENDPMVMSGLIGEPIAFSNQDFCRHTGLPYYEAINITKLPPKEEGYLSVAGKEVSVGDKISFADCERLVFSPSESAVSSCFSFTVGENYGSKCNIRLAEEFNYSPTASSALTAIETFSGMAVSGHMVAYDPEGDTLTYEITKYPKGNISFNNKTGNFTYNSTSTGKDSFSFVVKDDWGNYSKEATVELAVSSNTTGISFKDMKGNSAYAAAVNMIDDGIMTAAESNGEVFFEPDNTVSRLDFLICAMDTFKAGNLPDVESTGFADDGDIPAEYKKYVFSAQKLGIINGTENEDGKPCFYPNADITRAEAAVIINNIMGYTAACDFVFEDSVPAWASNSVSAMYELGVFSTDNGFVNADAKITKAETAQLLNRLKELIF